MSTTPTCWAAVALVVEVSAAGAGFCGVAELLPWPDTTLVPPPVAALMPRPMATAAAVPPTASAAIVPRRRRLGGSGGGGGYQYGPGHGGWFGLAGVWSIVINSTGWLLSRLPVGDSDVADRCAQ